MARPDRSTAELFDDVARFRAAGIPLGWVIVDNPWERGLCAGSLEFDPGLFPDPKGTFAHVPPSRDRRDDVGLTHGPRTCGLGIYPDEQVIGTETYRAIDLTDTSALAAFESGCATC